MLKKMISGGQTGDKYLHWAQMHMVIVRELWKRLQETHKLKVVK